MFKWKQGTDNVAVTIKIKDLAGTVVYQYDGNSNNIPAGVLYTANNGCGNANPTIATGELFASSNDGNIVLTWTGSLKSNYGYNVYRDGLLCSLVHSEEFVDVDPSLGGHCYQVCYLTDGGESVMSNEVCANAGEGCNSPKKLWYRLQNNMKPIITWEPAEGMTADDAYAVYKKIGDGEYEQVKLLGSDKTEYKDTKTFTEGEWYYYRVVALYADPECTSAPAKAKYGNEYFVKYQFSTDGVSENEAQVVSVYPNPAKDNLTVKAENLSSVVIYNSLGQKMFGKTFDVNEAVIDMSGFEAGIYMVRIVAGDNEITRKISVIR